MRRGTLRRLSKKNPNGLTWNQASGAYDPRAGVVGYRTIEGREYKVPATPAEEKAAMDRIIKAANKRRRKMGLEPLTMEELTNGPEQAQEGWAKDEEAGPDETPELDFGSFLGSVQPPDSNSAGT